MTNFSTKKWISVSIELNKKDDINFLYSNFCNDIIGTFENNGELVFYFHSKIKEGNHWIPLSITKQYKILLH